MSKPWLPRQPARRTLEQGEAGEKPARSALAERIMVVLDQRGAVLRLGDSQMAPYGYFRFRPADGAADLFIKVVAAEQAQRQARADAVARYVMAAGLDANCLLPGYPRAMGPLSAILAYPFIDGRPIRPELAEIDALGVTVGRLHAALAQLPGEAGVRDQAEARRLMLQDRQAVVLDAAAPPGPYPDRLHTLFATSPEAFEPFNEPQQVIHGDLNPGNLMFRGTNRDIVLFDFEDSLSAYLPPRIEVAYVLERHVLVPESDDAAAVDLGRRFLARYVETSGIRPFAAAGQFAASLRWLTLRSLCLLCEFDATGSPWPESEWLKFDRLVAMAEERQDVISAIEEPFLP